MRRIALNIAQKRLAAGLRPDPLGEVTVLPQIPLAGLRRKGRERESKEKEGVKGKWKEAKSRTLNHILSHFLARPMNRRGSTTVQPLLRIPPSSTAL